MPTHKGTSQTDITIGSGGTGVTLTAALSWTLTTDSPIEVRADDASAPLAVDGTQRAALLDATGATLGTLYTAFRAEATAAGATEGSRSRSDEASPLPVGGGVVWPTAPESAAVRDWSAFATGLGELAASFELATTGAAGVVVDQVVYSQTPDRLELRLTFRSGRTVLAEGVVVFEASAPGASTPVVDDQIQP